MTATGKHQLVRTRAGALAIRDAEAGEIMHPGVGALVEAQELYVRQSRLVERLTERGPGGTLVLFDVGLGAGSNALAARSAAEQAPAGAGRLQIVSFERDAGALQLALTEPAAFGLEGDSGQAARALLATGRHESARTSWRLVAGDLLQLLPGERTRADVVFWDPFSRKANPALWTVAAFSSLRQRAGDRCLLFTYSASTATRAALLLSGWAVGIGAATGAKAETTAAAVHLPDLARPLDRRWLTRLARVDAPLPPDAPPDARQRAASAEQFRF